MGSRLEARRPMGASPLTLRTEHDVVDAGGLLQRLTGIGGWALDATPTPGPLGLGVRATFRAEREVLGAMPAEPRQYFSGTILLWNGYAEVSACETDLDGMEIGAMAGGSWGIELDLDGGLCNSPYGDFFSASAPTAEAQADFPAPQMAGGPGV